MTRATSVSVVVVVLVVVFVVVFVARRRENARDAQFHADE
jgi:heme/copper-type cytochrome/quinol oxidase subunit 2